MRDYDQAQMFTVFGGSYVSEAHDHIPERRASRSVGPVAAVFVALLLGTATTAGAIAATKRVHASGYWFSTASYSIADTAGYQDAFY